MSGSPTVLTAGEARRIALFAQGLSGPRLRGSPAATLRRLGGVQLDTISVLARSHELVAYARHGPIGRAAIEEAYWGRASTTFEYWSHAACILPLEDWPHYAVTRRARQARGRRWHILEDEAGSTADVVARLRAEGPLTARQLGGAKKGGVWWDWSEIKIAAEWLLDTGVLVCRHRQGFQRVYDLAERAIPAGLAQHERSDEECAVALVEAAGRSLGVATAADLAVYKGLPTALVQRVVGETDPRAGDGGGLGQACVRGPRRHRRAQPAGQGPQRSDLSVRLAGLGQGAHRATLRLLAPARGLRAP